MKNLEEKKFSLERWKTILLTIGAISTFLTFFIPFLNQHEQQTYLAYSETLNRLGDENPAIRASAAIDLVHYYNYRSLFGLGPSPYRDQIVFVLQNSLENANEESFVRQAIIQALRQIDPKALEGAWLRGANLSNLDLRNISFERAYLAYANLSGSGSQEYQQGDIPVSFEGANLYSTNIANSEFWGANFKRVSFESANLSYSFFIKGTDLRNTVFWRTDLTHTIFSITNLDGANLDGATFDATILRSTDFSYASFQGAIFRNIDQWDDATNFRGANCQGAQFDITSAFYKWGQGRFPECFK